MSASLDQHGGKCEHGRRNRQAKRLRGLEVDSEIELGRHKHRQFRRLFSLENAPRIDAGFTIGVKCWRIRATPIPQPTSETHCSGSRLGESNVCARPVEARDQARLNRINTSHEHNGDRRGCCLGCEGRRGRVRHQHRDLTPNESAANAGSRSFWPQGSRLAASRRPEQNQERSNSIIL
jgi:hypothetical protein